MILLPPIKPPETVPIWDYTVTIGERRLRVRMVWWDRRAAWYLSLWIDGAKVLSGQRMTANHPLVWRFRLGFPSDVGAAGRVSYGRLCLYSFAGSGGECDQAGLGWTHGLYYIAPGDQTAPTLPLVGVT